MWVCFAESCAHILVKPFLWHSEFGVKFDCFSISFWFQRRQRLCLSAVDWTKLVSFYFTRGISIAELSVNCSFFSLRNSSLLCYSAFRPISSVSSVDCIALHRQTWKSTTRLVSFLLVLCLWNVESVYQYVDVLSLCRCIRRSGTCVRFVTRTASPPSLWTALWDWLATWFSHTW